MTQWYKVAEIAKPDGSPSGKFRKVCHNTSWSHVTPLCDHEHDSSAEAEACPVVVEEMERKFPTPVTCPTCGSHVHKDQLK